MRASIATPRQKWPPWRLALAVVAVLACSACGAAAAPAPRRPLGWEPANASGGYSRPLSSLTDALVVSDGKGHLRRLSDVTRFRKVKCGRPNYADFQEGCSFCWEYTPVDENGDPEDPVLSCAACQRGWALNQQDGTCDCARGYERKPCGKDQECCRRCARGTAWVGEGLSCEDKPGGRRFAFGATVELDRGCNDPAAAATLSTVKSAIEELGADVDPETLYVSLARCTNVLKDAQLGTVGGYYAQYAYRVEYWGSSGAASGAAAAAVRTNPNLFCGDRGEYYDSRCLGSVNEPGPGNVLKPQISRSWALSLPLQIEDAPVTDGGACPEGSRLKDIDKAARAALAPALRNLAGLRRLKKVAFTQCNRIAPLNSGQIELWYQIEESHEFDPATGQGPYEALFDVGVYGESAGGLLETLPTLSTLQPPVVAELAYVGPALTCYPGGPRQPPNEDPTDVTPSPMYYLANDGKLITMGEFFDPRLISPFGLIQKAGGASLDLLDSQDTGTTDVVVLAADGVRGKFGDDKLVAAGTMFYGKVKQGQKLTCPGFNKADTDAAGANSISMMGTLGQITAISLGANDDSEESDMDFDHFAVILKVTNVPYGTPVKQTDIIDLVWQNGDHQGDGVDTDDLFTDAIWYQIRRDLSTDGSETALNGPVKTAADSEETGTYFTLTQFAQQQTYVSSTPNGKGGLVGYRSTRLTPETRVLAAGIAILPARPFTYPDTDSNEDGIPDWKLASSRSYSVSTLSITFSTPFPSRGGAAPTSNPTTYSLQFGAPEAAA